MDKELKRKAVERIVLLTIGVAFTLLGLWIKGCFIDKKDVAPSVGISKSIPIEARNVAAHDVNDNSRVVHSENAFFDSSKQINNINYSGQIRQRHLDLKSLRPILDSIPDKGTKIEIYGGRETEAMNYGHEISRYLMKQGYEHISVELWSTPDCFDELQYWLEPNGTFKIAVCPQANAKKTY